MFKKKKNFDTTYKCPCGSGKEPQDCCFKNNSPSPKVPRFPIENQSSVISDFSRYDQIELISALAGLQIYSKNHSSISRLTTASQIACSIKKGGKEPIKVFDLQQLLTEYFPARGILSKYEDPPQDLQTENIEFINGNNITYSGISPDSGHILRIFLRSISRNIEEMPDEFFQKLIPSCLALLILSNEVAIRAGHHRYSYSDIQLWGDIEIPDKEEFFRLQKAVCFSPEEIHRLFKPYGIDISTLDTFITRKGSSPLLKGRIIDNPLYSRPIVQIDDTIILTIPAAVVIALRHYILVTAKKYKKIKQLASSLSDSYWLATQINLELLGFKPVNISLPPLNNTDDLIEGIYSFDSNKIAYIQLIVDKADSYQYIFPFKVWSDKKWINKINKRYEKIISWLLESKNPKFEQIFYILIFGSIGRSILIGDYSEQKNVRTLVITSENFDVLARIDNCDCIKLWKFVGHFDELCKYHNIISFTALDKFQFYLINHVPRDIWEGPGPATIVIPYGTGQQLRILAAKNTDIHTVNSGNPPCWITVTRYSAEPSEPVYVPEGTFLHPFKHVIESLPQPIWIEAGPRTGKIFIGDYPFYYQFVDVCSFWLWKITESIRPHLVPLGAEPIHITIDYEKFDEHGIIDLDVSEALLRPPAITIEKEKRIIHLTINGTIFNAIDENDNSGERCLVDTLLKSFGKLLEEYSFPNTLLNENTREQILTQYIPYGTKRKLFHITTGADASFDPRWLPTVRFLQDHDLVEQFNGLTKELEKKTQSESSISKDSITLPYNYSVEIYLKRLKKTISEYSWINLLSSFISQYEAHIHFSAIYRHNIQSSINLYYDLHTQVSHVLSQRELFDYSSISLRNLIEIISAEPPKGSRDVSKTEFDTILAGSHMFTHLGSLSDSLHFGLYNESCQKKEDIEPEPNEDSLDNSIEQFFQEKFHEGIEAAFEEYSTLPDRKIIKEKKVVDNSYPDLQEAFKAEFGLTLKQIFHFFAYVIDLGFELETSSPHLPISEFKTRIQSNLKWSDDEINLAIQQFSLKPRKKYEIPPKGYSKREIFPWFFNRRISYLMRPLIIGPQPEDDPLIFWGSRHMHEALMHLVQNIVIGRYRVDEKTAPEMRRIISKFQNDSSKYFENKVATWLKEHTSWIIDPAVFIAPNGKFHNDVNYGDIDVLAIDTSLKKIYAIECKMINYGRNPREISTEIRKILGDEGEGDSLMGKHLKRDAWLKDHVDNLCLQYNLPIANYEIKSLFVVSEELLTAYIRETPLPIIAFSKLKREGAQILTRASE